MEGRKEGTMEGRDLKGRNVKGRKEIERKEGRHLKGRKELERKELARKRKEERKEREKDGQKLTNLGQIACIAGRPRPPAAPYTAQSAAFGLTGWTSIPCRPTRRASQ
jgi:hypothetical protein